MKTACLIAFIGLSDMLSINKVMYKLSYEHLFVNIPGAHEEEWYTTFKICTLSPIQQ